MTRTRMGWLSAAIGAICLTAFAPSALGAFGAPVDVQTGTNSNPQVATDATGDAALAWEFGPTAQRVQARTLSAAGALGTVHELGSTTGTSDRFVRVATDSS